MRRIRITGLCLVAVLAIGAAVTASASAEAPEFGQCLKKAEVGGAGYSDSKCNKAVGFGAKYEWVPGFLAGENTFTMAGTVSTMKLAGGNTLTCTKWDGTGEYVIGTDNKHFTLMLNLKGCKMGPYTCTTSGKASGELTFNPLVGEVGFENSAETKTALKLEAAPGQEGFLIKFSCLGLKWEWIGNNPEKPGCHPKTEPPCPAGPEHGILVPIKPNVMAEKETLKFKQTTEGEQIPSKWEGNPKETFLESDFEETGFEGLAWTETVVVKNLPTGKKYELNTEA
jgi:hypothetical protein